MISGRRSPSGSPKIAWHMFVVDLAVQIDPEQLSRLESGDLPVVILTDLVARRGSNDNTWKILLKNVNGVVNAICGSEDSVTDDNLSSSIPLPDLNNGLLRVSCAFDSRVLVVGANGEFNVERFRDNDEPAIVPYIVEDNVKGCLQIGGNQHCTNNDNRFEVLSAFRFSFLKVYWPDPPRG